MLASPRRHAAGRETRRRRRLVIQGVVQIRVSGAWKPDPNGPESRLIDRKPKISPADSALPKHKTY